MSDKDLLEKRIIQYKWIDEYCLNKIGAEKDFKVEWQWTRYMINSKLFAAVCSYSDDRPIISLKCEPLFGQLMREQYEDIIAGYYMNKEHWNSVFLDKDVPDSVIKEMIDMSYNLIFKGLTKKAQKEITG